MHCNANPRKTAQATADTYAKVFDSRKRRIRGLWQRHGRFLANITITNDRGAKAARMVPLDADTLAAAKNGYARLITEHADDRLRPLGITPTVAEYAPTYEQQLDASGKRPSSIAKEKRYIARWVKELAFIRLNKMRAHHLDRVLTELAAESQALSRQTIDTSARIQCP